MYNKLGDYIQHATQKHYRGGVGPTVDVDVVGVVRDLACVAELVLFGLAEHIAACIIGLLRALELVRAREADLPSSGAGDVHLIRKSAKLVILGRLTLADQQLHDSRS
jgi:hypothetical protein